MRQELCLCAAIPRLEVTTKLIIVASRRELQIPTNTGRLAAQCLVPSVLLTRGLADQTFDLAAHLPPRLPSTGPALLLYPAPDAVILNQEFLQRLGTRPSALVVPDGNWRQTTKMRRRDPVMAGLTAVTLPSDAPSAYQVRKETKAGGLATIEAIARAYGVLEGDSVRQALESIFALMVARTMASRGQPVRQ